MRTVLKSAFGYEIERVDVHQDNYLVAITPETLLLGDMESCKLSEVRWAGSGQEKFVFDDPQVQKRSCPDTHFVYFMLEANFLRVGIH